MKRKNKTNECLYKWSLVDFGKSNIASVSGFWFRFYSFIKKLFFRDPIDGKNNNLSLSVTKTSTLSGCTSTAKLPSKINWTDFKKISVY